MQRSQRWRETVSQEVVSDCEVRREGSFAVLLGCVCRWHTFATRCAASKVVVSFSFLVSNSLLLVQKST